MSPIDPTSHAPSHDRLHRLFPLLLVALLPLFPPETRAEGAAGAALAIAVFFALQSGALARTRLIPALLGGLLLCFPAALLAQAPGAAVEPLSVWILFAALGAATLALRREARSGPLLFAVLAVTGCVAAFQALVQVLWGLDHLAATIRLDPPTPGRELLLERLAEGRAFAAFATPAALGGFLALVLPVTVGLGLAGSGRRRGLWLAAAALQLAGLLATASLSAALGLTAAALVFAARRPAAGRSLALAAAVALAALVAIVALRGSEVTEASATSHPLRLRAANFRVAFEVLRDHPWTGVGPGGFAEVYPQYRRAGDNESQHVHDLPLELCAEWGLPAGLLGSALLLWFWLAPLLRLRQDETAWERGAAVGLGALALQGLLDFAVLLPSLLWLSALLRAWIARREPEAAPRTGAAAALALAGVAAASAIAASAGLAWETRLAARQFAAAGRPAEAGALARRATTLAPWNPDGWLGRAEIVAGPAPSPPTDVERLAEARRAIERAVALAPVRPAARMARARLRAGAGDAPGAYADAALAARLYPLRVAYAAARDDLERTLARALAETP